MAQVRLTEKSIKRKAPKHGQPAIELWDSSCQGLCLRISYGGKRTYNVMPRINGRQVRYRLGTTESLSLSEARDMARDVFKNAAKGIDPREADRQAKIEAERSRRNSFRSVFEDYLADYAADLRTKDKIKKTMEREVLPLWGSRPIKGITRADVKQLVRDKRAKGAAVASNRLHSLIRTVLNYALGEDIIEANPAARIGKRILAEEHPRERRLSDDELRRVWLAAEELGAPFGPMIKTMILTGQREGQVANLKWTDIKDGGNWTVTRKLMKGNQEHLVPLPPFALEVINSVKRVKGINHIFASGKKGDKAPSGFSKLKVRLDTKIAELAAEAAGEKLDTKKHALEAWVFHDLRRTLRSGLAQLKVRPDDAERVIAHSVGSKIQQTYDVYDYADEKREALKKWTDGVQRIIRGGSLLPPRKTPSNSASNVADFEAARAKRKK